MPVTQQEQTKPCEVSLEIEVEQDKVSKAVDEAYREAGRRTAIPGFRKGKAPRPILERHISEEWVLERAAEKLLWPEYQKAVEEVGIAPFAEPSIELIHIADAEPLKFKAKVPLPPTVELGKYAGIEAERLTQKVSDEDVDREIQGIRDRFAKVENIEGRPVQSGDLVIVEMTEPGGETRETIVEAGSNLPSFDEGIIGMNAGETKTIELTYPEDYEEKDLAGTKSEMVVTVKDIKGRTVPELTDEFVREIAQKSGEKLESVEELKNKIRSNLEQSAADLADRKVESEVVDKVAENAQVCFPEVMLDHDVAHRLQDLISELKSRNMTLDDYLESTGRSFEQLRSEIERSAERDLKTSLVLGEIAEKEKIEVSDEELEAEVAKIAESSGQPKESIDAYLDKTDGKSAIRNRLLTRKVLDFLVNASNIKSIGRSAS